MHILYKFDLSHEGMAGCYLGSTIGIYQINHTYFPINVSGEGFEPGTFSVPLLKFEVAT